MNPERRFSPLLALLFLLALLPISSQAAPTGKTFNLTQMFGIRNVWEICYFDRAHAATLSVQPGNDDLKTFTVTFINLAEVRVTGQARFVRGDGPVSVTTQGERLCLLFDVYDADDNAIAQEEMCIAQDGTVTTRALPAAEEGFSLPGGAWIVEQDNSLFLRAKKGAALKPLLTSIPYPMEDDSPDPLYFYFFAALDDHRFVYTRIGWDGAKEGCGEYDLTTGESRRLDEQGLPCLIYEGRLFTNQSVVDLKTYRVQPVPPGIRVSMNTEGRKWAISPDGRLLCELLKPTSFDQPALCFYAMETGAQLGVSDLDLHNLGQPIFIAPDTVGVIGRTTDGKEESILMIARL